MSNNTKKNVSIVFIIVVSASICEFFTNVFLGRTLTPFFYGKFKFLHSALLMLSTLLVFGQRLTLIRVLSDNKFSVYNWKKFIRNCIGVGSFVGAIIIILIGLYYNIYWELFFLYFALITFISTNYNVAVLRSSGKHMVSAILTKGFSFLLFLFLFFCYFLFHRLDLYFLLSLYLLSFLVSFFISLISTRKIECGEAKIPKEQIKSGIWLFFSLSFFALMINIDRFFIAKMLNYEDVAKYSVAFAITRLYELTSMALGFVLLPLYSKGKKRLLKLDFSITFIIIIMITVFYLFFGKFLIHFLFKGKYDSSIHLLKYFLIMGIFHVLNVIPTNLIGAVGSNKFLKFFFISSLITVLINLLGNYFFITYYGLTGAAIATAITWFFRVSSTYYLLWKEKNILKTFSP